MIFGLGLDLARVARFERALARFGPRLGRRCFTAAEWEHAMARPKPAAALALRWAAKEAFVKAAGLGMARLAFTEIEVAHAAGGRPLLRLHGAVAQWARDNGGLTAHLSLTDDGDYAAAVVVLEKP